MQDNYIVTTEYRNGVGTLKLSSDSVSPALHLSSNETSPLKLTGDTISSKLTLDGTELSSIALAGGDTDPILTISSDSLAPILNFKPAGSSNLIISAINTPPNLEVGNSGVTSNLSINSVFISDLSIEVGSTTTLPPGSSATVTNSGDRKHVILNFGIPSGGGSGATSWGTITGNITNQIDLKQALDSKQNLITNLTTIENNALAGKQAKNTIDTYGNIVTHNTSEFATAEQGTKADSALQSGDNVTELTNDAGYVDRDVNDLHNYTNNTDLDIMLDDKITKNIAILGGSHAKITYDEKGLVLGGADLVVNDIPEIPLAKLSDVTATSSEVNVLQGIQTTTTALNYTKDVTSNIQTQLNNKQPTITNLPTIESNAEAGKNASDTIATYGDVVNYDADEFATSTQGAKADSAVQPNDNISKLVNNVGYMVGNNAISGGTATKVTYDEKGLVTSSSDADATDIAYSNPQYTTVASALDKLLYVNPSVSLSGGGTYESGTIINSVNLTWSWNKTITSQSLNQGIGSLPVNTRSYTYSTPFTSSKTFTITGSDGANSATSSTTVSIIPKRYWGVSINSTLTDADILNLSQELSTSRAQTRTFDCSGGKYFYFVIRTDYCTGITFKVGGLAFSDLNIVTRNVVNAKGLSASYNIYRCNDPQQGSAIPVQVS